MTTAAYLPPLPAGWGAKPIKRAYDVQLGKMLQNEAESDADAAVPYLKAQHVQWESVTTQDLPSMWANPRELTQFGVRENDLLVCEGGEVGRAAILRNPPPDCIIQNALHRLRAHTDDDPRFLLYVLRHIHGQGWFDVLCNKATIAHLTGDKLNNLVAPFPSAQQQRRIVDWLDDKIRALDEVNQRKAETIDRLQLRRDGLIAQAISGRDQPHARVATGNPFLPDMPAQWKIAPLKRHWQVIDCKHKTVEFLGDGIPLASIGEVHGLEVDLTNAKRTTLQEATELREGGRYPQPSDIIYSRNATVGDAAMVMPGQDLAMGQDVCLIRGVMESQRYLQHQLHSRFILGQLDVLMVGATFKRINVGDIKSFMVFIPPVAEMPRIASLCDTIHGDFTKKIGIEQESCNKIALYRQSLITAAVTGQVSLP